MKRTLIRTAVLSTAALMLALPLNTMAQQPEEKRSDRNRGERAAEREDRRQPEEAGDQERPRRSPEQRQAVQQQAEYGQQSVKFQVSVPSFLQELDLSDRQQQAIKATLLTHQKQLIEVWKKYHNVNMDLVELQATIWAAMDDKLSEQQKELMKNRGARDEGSESFEGERLSRGAENRFVLGLRLMNPEARYKGLNLTDDQRARIAKVREAYMAVLKRANDQRGELFQRMVEIEASKIAHIEALLDKEQLQQVKQIRGEGNTTPRGEQSAQNQGQTEQNDSTEGIQDFREVKSDDQEQPEQDQPEQDDDSTS